MLCLSMCAVEVEKYRRLSQEVGFNKVLPERRIKMEEDSRWVGPGLGSSGWGEIQGQRWSVSEIHF